MPLLLQLIILGLIAIAVIAALAAWLYPQADSGNVDNTEMADAIAEHELDVHPGNILLTSNGQAAIAQLQDDARLAVLRRMGDAYSMRLFSPPDMHLHGSSLSFSDFTWPDLKFDIAEAVTIRQWLHEPTESKHAA